MSAKPAQLDRLIQYFQDDAHLAIQIAGRLAVRSAGIRMHQFPDGETLVRVRVPSPAESILVCSLHHPDSKLVATMLAADAMRRAGAHRIVLVSAYMPYMRQDKVFEPGEPLSQRVIGEMLGRSFDRVLTVEAHLHRVHKLRDVVPCNAKSVSAAPAIAGWVRRFDPQAAIVGPDEESRAWIQAIARGASLDFAVGRKERTGDKRVQVHFHSVPKSPHAIIVDDIGSSGATLAAAARSLRAHGIRTVDAVVVHAIFAPGAIARIRRAGVRRIVSCDTIKHPTNAISVAGILAAALGEAK